VHIPESLAPLFDNGTIERVVRPLQSGKEAQVFLVMSRGELCVAKVYKDAQQRSFKNRAAYTEGRKTRNSRDQRAIEKRSAHGRAQDEAAWKSTEVDMIHRLHAGGVRVPIPKAYIDGVLVMECVVDAEGNPAARLGELSFEPDVARGIYDRVIQEAVRMLAVGVVHGDLSPFNVLAGADGPVIIDFPQSVDAAGNTNARRLLLRDVENFHNFLQTFVPRAPRIPYAEEMWDLFEQASLTGETRLSGRYAPTAKRVSTESVLGLIQDADYDESRRRERQGIRGGPKVPAGPPPVYQSKGTRSGGIGTAMKLTPRSEQGPETSQQPTQRDDRGPQGSHSQRDARPPFGARPQQQDSRQGPPRDARPQHDARPQRDARPQHQDSRQGPPARPPFDARPPQQDSRQGPPREARPQHDVWPRHDGGRPQQQDSRQGPPRDARPQHDVRPQHDGGRPQQQDSRQGPPRDARPQHDVRPQHDGGRPQHDGGRPQQQDSRQRPPRDARPQHDVRPQQQAPQQRWPQPGQSPHRASDERTDQRPPQRTAEQRSDKRPPQRTAEQRQDPPARRGAEPDPGSWSPRSRQTTNGGPAVAPTIIRRRG